MGTSYLSGSNKGNRTCFEDNDLKKLKAACISGLVFLIAGDAKFFKNECNLPIGTSVMLANLAREITGGENASIKSKLLSFISCTCRQ
jgi:hypothetical protein